MTIHALFALNQANADEKSHLGMMAKGHLFWVTRFYYKVDTLHRDHINLKRNLQTRVIKEMKTIVLPRRTKS